MNTPHARTLSFPALTLPAASAAPAEWPLAMRVLLYRMAIGLIWSDFELSPRADRALLSLASELDLPPSVSRERHQGPPLPEEMDPMRVPPALAPSFLRVLRRVAIADGLLRGERAANLSLIEELWGPPRDVASAA